MDAQRSNARPFRLRHSQSSASRRPSERLAWQLFVSNQSGPLPQEADRQVGMLVRNHRRDQAAHHHKKRHHLSTGLALKLREHYGAETPDGV